MSILNRAYYRSNLGVGEGQEAPSQNWEKREGEERSHTNSTWIWFMDGFGTLED